MRLHLFVSLFAELSIFWRPETAPRTRHARYRVQIPVISLKYSYGRAAWGFIGGQSVKRRVK